MTRSILRPLAAAFAALAACALAPAGARACELDRPVVFAGLDYESASFHTAVARFIVERGYGCRTERVAGSTIPLVSALGRGELDVVMEIWLANPVEPWVAAEREGRAVALGTTFPDATEGWFVPRALVQGPNARAPDLRSVTDLARYRELFQDPDEPERGRFFNCVPGWQCELVNSRKLVAYGLDQIFTNVRPASSEALNAAIDGLLRRGRPVVFYHWSPSWLIGSHDLVRLEEPPHDPQIWREMLNMARPGRATAYPVSRVVIGGSRRFVDAAPRLAAFFRAYGTTTEETSSVLAAARQAGLPAENMATRFLRERAEIWTRWVPAEVAERVRRAL
jgi:glycine betaine/proline transport system substrate-binding protein